METSAFISDAETRPVEGQILWTEAEDGVKLRVALWPREDAKGTVLIFSGRTEYIEKYGPAALDLGARGYAVATLDWRGQGRSDRVGSDPTLGHVGTFADYQLDVAAFLVEVEKAGMPKPYHLIAHSMGGAIGLRSILNGLDVNSVVFSAPMWRLPISPMMRPPIWGLAFVCELLGQSEKLAPSTDRENYVATAPFEGNELTHDPDMFDFMVKIAHRAPELNIGGPTCGWVYAALKECRNLRAANYPNLPALVSLGADETIVAPEGIFEVVDRWPSARAKNIPDCRHEIMMEVPALRTEFFDTCAQFFEENSAKKD